MIFQDGEGKTCKWKTTHKSSQKLHNNFAIQKKAFVHSFSWFIDLFCYHVLLLLLRARALALCWRKVKYPSVCSSITHCSRRLWLPNVVWQTSRLFCLMCHKFIKVIETYAGMRTKHRDSKYLKKKKSAVSAASGVYVCLAQIGGECLSELLPGNVHTYVHTKWKLMTAYVDDKWNRCKSKENTLRVIWQLIRIFFLGW